MSDPSQVPLESEEALFDVVVHLPSGVKLEDILERAVNVAGIEPSKAEALINALRSVPSAKVGVAVPRSRADKARSDLTKAGLHVEVTPVLSLQAALATPQDTRYKCPACNTAVELDDKRQCPACGVFVDKITEDFLLRKKIMEQEKAKLDYASAKDAKDSDKRAREMREAAIRKQVRDELEKELGLDKKPGLLDRFPNATKAIGIVVLLTAGFFGGRSNLLPGSEPAQPAQAAAKPTPGADIDRMLNSMGDKSAAGALAAEGDPDAEDSLLQAGAERRSQGKGISVEQAVAASKMLAASVGHKMPGEGGAKGGAGGAGGAAGAAAAAGAAGASGAAAGGAAEAADTGVTPQLKAELKVEFARDLAEMGQVARARELVKVLIDAPEVKGDPAFAARVKLLEFEVQAWSLKGTADASSRTQLDNLRLNAGLITDPLQRTLALASIATVLARHPLMPPEPATAFVTLANDALKGLSDPGQVAAGSSAILTALGYSLLSETGRRARAGEWSRARAAATQLESLTKDAPTAETAVRLLGLDAQAKLVMGNSAAVTQHMDAALGLIAKQPSLEVRANLLRVLAHASEAHGHEKLRAAAAQLAEAAAGKTGRDKAATLAALSVLSADAGHAERAAALRKEAIETAGLSTQEAGRIDAQSIVRTELATARAAHAIRAYAQAEAQLQKVADYLL